MVKISESEWQAFKEKTGYKNTEDDKQKQDILRRKKMKDAERIQYYPSDLAYALDIGEIADMYVVTENGTQILRMTVIPKKHDEFKTVRAAPVKDTRKTVKRKYIPREPTPGIIRMQGRENPERLGERMMNYGKGFMKNISKPLFMNR